MKSINEILREMLLQKGIEYVSCIAASELSIIQVHLHPKNINSAFFWLIPYYTGTYENRNVSLYALGKDYHLFSKRLSEELSSKLKEIYPQEEFYFFCDSSPVNEVEAASKAGLGVIGKNRLLINEKYGSYVFIGSLMTTLKAETQSVQENKTCLECGACVRECEFLCGKRDYCYSELNQRKNVTEYELEIIKSRKIRWGCDDCQEACPMNKNVSKTPILFFYEDLIKNVTAENISDMTKEQFCNRAYSWRGKKTITRNLL